MAVHRNCILESLFFIRPWLNMRIVKGMLLIIVQTLNLNPGFHIMYARTVEATQKDLPIRGLCGCILPASSLDNSA